MELTLHQSYKIIGFLNPVFNVKECINNIGYSKTLRTTL